MESYAVPKLPETDPAVGEIKWRRWEKCIEASNLDGSCATCGYPGPLRESHGKTFHTPPEKLVRLERSSIHPKKPSKWVRKQNEPYWAYTHYATFCPQCLEMKAWRKGKNIQEWEEISCHPPRTVEPADINPGQQTLF